MSGAVVTDPKRQSIMQVFDQMPRALRVLVNRYGWNPVVNLVDQGLSDPVAIEQILRHRLAERMKSKGVEVKL